MQAFKVCLSANIPAEIEFTIEAEDGDSARVEALAQARAAADHDWQLCGDAFEIHWQSIEPIGEAVA